MIKTLNAGAIGVGQPSLEVGIGNALRHGFQGLEFDPGSLAAYGAEKVRDSGVTLEAFGLSVEWRGDEAKFKEGLAGLGAHADVAASVGCTRCATWVLPGSNNLGFDACTAFHRERFRPIADILGERGISLGLEFIGPRHLRDMFKYPWIYSMEAMLDFGATVGPNVGILLDAYHWHTSNGTLDQIRRLDPARIVLVHLNDALPGIERDQLPDGTRELPSATGVIDLVGFVEALNEIGYQGPASIEPFKKELADLPDDDARLAAVSGAFDKTLAAGK